MALEPSAFIAESLARKSQKLQSRSGKVHEAEKEATDSEAIIPRDEEAIAAAMASASKISSTATCATIIAAIIGVEITGNSQPDGAFMADAAFPTAP